jgi:hypothetical protein
MLSFNMKGDYHHFRLHRDMRPMFRVRVDPGGGLPERFFEFVALPFGWSMSDYWFCRLTRRSTVLLRNCMGCRVLVYMDDFLVCRSQGAATTRKDCRLFGPRSYPCDKLGCERASYQRGLDRAFLDSDVSRRSSFSGPTSTYCT